MHRRWIGPTLVLGTFAFSALVFPSLPERIATHWNAQGEPDSFISRWPAAFLLPGLALLVLALLTGLRRVDPTRSERERSGDADGTGRAYWSVVHVVLAFLAVLQLFTLAPAFGWELDLGRGILLLVGLLFAAIGLQLPRLEPNWWIGIRTPWTMSSRRAWERTHEVGRRSFVAAGLAAAALALLPAEAGLPLGIAAVFLGAMVPVVYSYFAWRGDPERTRDDRSRRARR